jgi:hypothetical protein
MIPRIIQPIKLRTRFAAAPLNSASAPHLRLNDNVEESKTGSVFPECAIQVYLFIEEFDSCLALEAEQQGR